MTETPATQPRLRADAQRNRLRILAAAREVFAEKGLDASLDEIAAVAGVGVGTVYRRFPDKDALIDTLFEERLADVAQLGRQALQMEDAWEAFQWFVNQMGALRARDRGLKQALVSRGRERVQRMRDTIAPIGSELILNAQRSGRLREDLALVDMPLIQLMVSAIADLTREVSPETYRRMLQIVIDGLATTRAAPTPLPTAPIDQEELFAAIAERGCP